MRVKELHVKLDSHDITAFKQTAAVGRLQQHYITIRRKTLYINIKLQIYLIYFGKYKLAQGQ